MTLLKLFALIRISGTSKMELGRSWIASHSHDSQVSESPRAHSYPWALPEAAQKVKIVIDTAEGCHLEKDVSPSEDPDLMQGSFSSFQQKEKPAQGLCLYSVPSIPWMDMVPTPVDWALHGCNIEQ